MNAARMRENNTFFIIMASLIVSERYDFLNYLYNRINYTFEHDYYQAAMKITKVQLSEKDKRRAYKTAIRKASVESGIDKITRSKVYRNRKKYSRKNKKQTLRQDEKLG
jgi:hypothetical protein